MKSSTQDKFSSREIDLVISAPQVCVLKEFVRDLATHFGPSVQVDGPVLEDINGYEIRCRLLHASQHELVEQTLIVSAAND